MCEECPIELVLGSARHREFVRSLSADAFSRFGDYDVMLPAMMNRPWVRIVVAEVEAEPIGFAMYSLEELGDGEIDLVAIAVIPDWRSRGVGRRLLDHVESESRYLVPDGTPTVHLTVAQDNTRARRMFERAGYAPVPGERGFYPRGQRSIGLHKRVE